MIYFLCQTKSLEYFVVSFFHVSKVTTETVFVEFFVRVDIPQTAGIRRDFVGKNNGTVARFTEFDFEVDEFHGDNAGLIVAEVELGSTEEDFVRPEWIGKEVTGDRRYYNSQLRAQPYKSWNL